MRQISSSLPRLRITIDVAVDPDKSAAPNPAPSSQDSASWSEVPEAQPEPVPEASDIIPADIYQNLVNSLSSRVATAILPRKPHRCWAWGIDGLSGLRYL